MTSVVMTSGIHVSQDPNDDSESRNDSFRKCAVEGTFRKADLDKSSDLQRVIFCDNGGFKWFAG